MKSSAATLQASVQTKDREIERIRGKFEELQKQKATQPVVAAAAAAVAGPSAGDVAQLKKVCKHMHLTSYVELLCVHNDRGLMCVFHYSWIKTRAPWRPR